MGTVTKIKRDPPTRDIIDHYIEHLKHAPTSNLHERLAFSVWMYTAYPQWIGHISEIWAEMKRK